MNEDIVLHTYQRRSAGQAKSALLMCISLSWASVGYPIDPEFGKPPSRTVPANSRTAVVRWATAQTIFNPAKVGDMEFPFETLLRERHRRKLAAEAAEKQRRYEQNRPHPQRGGPRPSVRIQWGRK